MKKVAETGPEEEISQELPQKREGAGLADMIAALMPLFVPAYFFYGERPLFISLVTVLAALAADILCTRMRGRKIGVHNLSAAVTGLIIALLMPASVSYAVPISAALFAILVVKHPFGGYGRNIFNPAAAGYAFAAVLFPKAVFSFPAPFTKLAADAAVQDLSLQNSLLAALKLRTLPQTSLFSLMLGGVPGPMGTTGILIIAACLLYLLVRRVVKFQTVLPFLITVFAFAWLFPRIPGGRLASAGYEMMAGPLLFCGVYMVSDPATMPKTGKGAAAYGILCGLLAMVFRYYGAFEEGFCFALLIANALAGWLDRQLSKISFKELGIRGLAALRGLLRRAAGMIRKTAAEKGGAGNGHSNHKKV